MTAAPDAYGVLLPERAVRVMRPGARGFVLVDGPARAYEPHLRVVGRLVARIPAGPGFLRPDGMIDDARLGFAVGVMVANTDQLPGWVPGDEFEAARKALGH